MHDPEMEVGTALERVLMAIGSERRRQDALKAAGRFDYTAADPIPPGLKLAMLGEEFGEVARQVLTQPETGIAHDTEGSLANLRKELTHVAAVAAAWLETL